MLSCLFFAALWSPAGKELTSWLSCVLCFIVFATFPIGVLRQVWDSGRCLPLKGKLGIKISNHSNFFKIKKRLLKVYDTDSLV